MPPLVFVRTVGARGTRALPVLPNRAPDRARGDARRAFRCPVIARQAPDERFLKARLCRLFLPADDASNQRPCERRFR